MNSVVFDKIISGHSLSRPESRQIMTSLMAGELSATQIAAYLVALRTKGETVDELTGAAEAMRDAAIEVPHGLPFVVDTCGTGGDGKGAFNVSTAASFVVAALGFPVAKHGNRSISSRCGSADLLETLGVGIQSDASLAAKCLQDIGMAFLFAPAFHPAMKHAMPVRKQLGVRTIFNILGPLTNPARPVVQLVGVYDKTLVEPVAHVLVALGCKEGFVVHGEGYDEIILSGETQVAEIHDGKISAKRWNPSDFGMDKQTSTESLGSGPKENALMFSELIEGKKSPLRHVVCANAAAVVVAATRLKTKKTMTLPEAFQLAQEAIDSGKAYSKFNDLKRMTAHG